MGQMDADFLGALAAPAPGPGAGSAAARIYADLRDRIVEMELKPDSTLSRNKLALAFGVSLTPVREALQRLEQDGLVRIYPQSKTVVTRIEADAAAEAQFLRVGLETEVVRRLAERRDAALTARLRSILKMQAALVGDIGQAEMFNTIDRAFHRTMFDALGLSASHALLQSKLGHLARCQRLELPREGKMRQILTQHEAIVEGVAAGDPEAASAAMRVHVSGTISRVATLRQEFPDYFSGAGARG